MNRGLIYSRQVKWLNGLTDMNRQTVFIKLQNRVNQCVAGCCMELIKKFSITVCLVSALALIIRIVKKISLIIVS